jgi:hypothetical protein
MAKWTATWNGHTIVAERKAGFGENLVLSVDGIVIGKGHDRSGFSGLAGEAKGEFKDANGSTVIVAKVSRSSLHNSLTAMCCIYANDRIILDGGSPDAWAPKWWQIIGLGFILIVALLAILIIK